MSTVQESGAPARPCPAPQAPSTSCHIQHSVPVGAHEVQEQLCPPNTACFFVRQTRQPQHVKFRVATRCCRKKNTALTSPTQTLPSNMTGKCRKGMWRHVIKKKLDRSCQLVLYSAAEHEELKDISGNQASKSHTAQQ